MNIPFDECWLINLVERPDRKEYMLNQFRELNMDVKYHQAVKGPDWIYNIFCNSINKQIYVSGEEFRGWMDVPHAIGCWREHYTLIKSAYLRGLNSIMVIEDDCGFIKDEKLLQEYLDNLPDDWDILKLNCLRGDKTEQYVEDFSDKYGYWFPQINTLWGTGCYAMNRRAMKYILDWYEIYFASIDTPMAHPYNTKLYGENDKLYNKISILSSSIKMYIPRIPLGLCKDEVATVSDLHQDLYDKYKCNNKSIYYLHNNFKTIDINNYF